MSHHATCWALDQRDLPLGHRMILVLLADCHCPDNGCIVDVEWLARKHIVDPAELEKILEELERDGHLARLPGSDRILLGFEGPAPGRGVGK